MEYIMTGLSYIFGGLLCFGASISVFMGWAFGWDTIVPFWLSAFKIKK